MLLYSPKIVSKWEQNIGQFQLKSCIFQLLWLIFVTLKKEEYHRGGIAITTCFITINSENFGILTLIPVTFVWCSVSVLVFLARRLLKALPPTFPPSGAGIRWRVEADGVPDPDCSATAAFSAVLAALSWVWREATSSERWVTWFRAVWADSWLAWNIVRAWKDERNRSQNLVYRTKGLSRNKYQSRYCLEAKPHQFNLIALRCIVYYDKKVKKEFNISVTRKNTSNILTPTSFKI